MNHIFNKAIHWIEFSRNALVLGCVLLLGFALRIWQIGRYSFWFDEAGVAMAASADNLWQAIEMAQRHAAAMPIDYMVAWLMARFSLSEGWLRLPSVMWGTATLVTAFLLYRRLTMNFYVASAAVLLVATSPLMVYYSQELRFYASGVFFYLLVTILLFRALDRNRFVDWFLCFGVLAIGSYDYLYVLLACLNGLVWVGQNGWRKLLEGSRLRNGFLTGLFLFVLVAPGMWVFGAESYQGYEQSVQLAINSILIGLGWLPFTARFEPTSFVYTLLCFLFSVVAIVSIIRGQMSALKGLLISGMVQVGLILLADWISGYFFAPRQFLLLLPFSCLLAVLGMSLFWQKKTPLIGRVSEKTGVQEIQLVNRIFTGAIVFVLLVCNGIAIRGYYETPKSYTREMSQALATIWRPGDHIRTIPSFEPLAYQFYLEKYLKVSQISDAFENMPLEAIGSAPVQPGRVYVVCKYPLLESEQQTLIFAGFQSVQLKIDTGAPLLWYKDFSQ